jgi:hypothetical protein
MTITLTREDAQQVLDALEIEQEAHAYLQLGKADHIENAIKFLRARLSAPECVCGEPNTAGVHRQDGPCYQQPEPEPVAWMNESDMGRTDWKVWAHGKPTATIPLYTAPKEKK